MKAASYLVRSGKWLMQLRKLRILIADDEATYFNPQMLALANAAGYHGIERISTIDNECLKSIVSNPPDIIILDVKGVCTPDVAKDGIELANLLSRETSIMVVITSAHKFHLRGSVVSVDHVIEERKLTAVDFVDELSTIVDKLLCEKVRFYKHLTFRAGFALARGALQKVG